MKEEKLRNIENESLLNLANIKIRGIGLFNQWDRYFIIKRDIR